MKNKQFVVSVMSKDRPGIISDVTTVIYNLGGDLAGLNQSVLGGYFTMILMVEFPEGVTVETLMKTFSAIGTEPAIEAIIKEVDGVYMYDNRVLPCETYVVTAQGGNRKGLVKLLGDFFYARAINVLDLVTARRDELYTMIFQVDLSHIESMNRLRKELKLLAGKENLDVVLQHNDIYMATNEVGLPLDAIIGS